MVWGKSEFGFSQHGKIRMYNKMLGISGEQSHSQADIDFYSTDIKDSPPFTMTKVQSFSMGVKMIRYLGLLAWVGLFYQYLLPYAFRMLDDFFISTTLSLMLLQVGTLNFFLNTLDDYAYLPVDDDAQPTNIRKQKESAL